jgi:hypothetical protein
MASPGPLEIASTALKVISIVLEVAKIIQKLSDDSKSEFDQQMAELQLIRTSVDRFGHTILQAINAARVEAETFEMNRIRASAERALDALQRARKNPGAVEFALDASADAVQEMTGVAQFKERRFDVAGQFMYIVSVRLQVWRELEPDFCLVPRSRAFITEWVAILRQYADYFETDIRNRNPQYRVTVDEEYDPERKPPRVIYGYQYDYTNLTGTYSFSRFYKKGSSGRGDAENARRVGADMDVEALGVNKMRQTASAWESLLNICMLEMLTKQVLQRPLTATETGMLMLSKSSITPPDTQPILSALMQTREFRTTFVEPLGDKTQDVVNLVHERLFGCAAKADELKLYTEVYKRCGYSAMIGALTASDQLRETQQAQFAQADLHAEAESPAPGLTRLSQDKSTLDVLSALR